VESDELVLEEMRRVFRKRGRPEHFTNYRHCDECAEHDDVLRARDVTSLQMEDVGNPGWDPICFISPEGFAYYLPALVRLALAEPTKERGWYVPQLLFHLCSDGRQNQRILECTVEERRAVVRFLKHVVETRAELADSYSCAEELCRAIEYWSE
jgi:hypothetical protein